MCKKKNHENCKSNYNHHRFHKNHCEKKQGCEKKQDGKKSFSYEDLDIRNGQYREDGKGAQILLPNGFRLGFGFDMDGALYGVEIHDTIKESLCLRNFMEVFPEFKELQDSLHHKADVILINEIIKKAESLTDEDRERLRAKNS